MPQNSITVIKPYKWEGQWVFDDDAVGLIKEPFVAGADTLIDVATEPLGIENANEGFLRLFSATPFPNADLHLSFKTMTSVLPIVALGIDGAFCHTQLS